MCACIRAGGWVGEMLAINATLAELGLSWNNIKVRAGRAEISS